MAIFRGSGSSLTGSAIDPTEALLDSDFTVNGILVRTASGVYSTTPDNTANWDTAYSWGDHAAVGYYEPGGADVAVADGGTGASSASGARTNLGLGTAAEADLTTSATDTTAGRAMKVPYMGIGLTSGATNTADLHGVAGGGIRYWGQSNPLTANMPSDALWGEALLMDRGNTASMLLIDHDQDKAWIKRKSSGSWQDAVELYHRLNILGTVSQSSGVPTGAIIEQGSNSNGEYTKFADGTMICTRSLSHSSIDVDTAVGSVYRSSAQTWTFPVEFESTPVVFGAVWAGFSQGTSYISLGFTSASETDYYIVSSISGTDRGPLEDLLATGRWF